MKYFLSNLYFFPFWIFSMVRATSRCFGTNFHKKDVHLHCKYNQYPGHWLPLLAYHTIRARHITQFWLIFPSLALGIYTDTARDNHQSTCSNIETRMDRPKSVVRVVRGVV